MQYLIFLFCILSFSAFGDSLKTSLIIPCFFGHFRGACSLIETYRKQTVLPDEVVISVSSIQDKDLVLNSVLFTEKWPFEINVLMTEEPKSAAQNRNLASKVAKGDIFIYQDSDDLPYDRRIEVIKHFFETLKIDHLLHHYIYEVQDFRDFDEIEKISYYKPRYFSPNIGCNPAVAIRREVFDVIQWPESISHGEDSYFNEQVLTHFSTIVVEFPLYKYFRREIHPIIKGVHFENAR